MKLYSNLKKFFPGIFIIIEFIIIELSRKLENKILNSLYQHKYRLLHMAVCNH